MYCQINCRKVEVLEALVSLRHLAIGGISEMK